MSESVSFIVPETAAGAATIINVPMIAPSQSGRHTGRWQAQTPNGVSFGESLFVTIEVIAPDAPPITTSESVTPTPAPAWTNIKHVVIISIDGLRPDALDIADTPTLDALRLAGAYSSNAKSVLPSDTMPNHASMLGGMSPAKHGLIWNIPYEGAPKIKGPTLFSLAHEAGKRTALVVGKDKLEYLVLPGSAEFIYAGSTDAEVKNRAIEVIQAGLPQVLFIHLPDVDKTGHAVGWMTPGQLETIAATDRFLGEIKAALEAGGYLPHNTLLIVTADHGGGSDGTHGSDLPEDTTVPWLAVGPGVPVGLTLTSPINMYDTAATALYALNLPRPAEWDGQPVLEIFE